jgi:hypothetical protein
VKVSLGLDVTTTAPPTSTGRNGLIPADDRLAERVGGAWTRLTVYPGDCDPFLGAKLGGPFDLAPGAGRNLHLRMRVADSTPAQLRSVEYSVIAAPKTGEAQSVWGHLVIEPRQAAIGSGYDGSATSGDAPGASTNHPAAASGAQPAAAGSQPAALTSMPLEAAAHHANIGAVVLSLAGGITILLGGIVARAA